MTLHDHIRQWLGIKDYTGHLNNLTYDIGALSRLLQDYRYSVEISMRLQARIIAKLDPNYSRDELDPVRRAESDAIAEQVITKMQAEFTAQRRFDP